MGGWKSGRKGAGGGGGGRGGGRGAWIGQDEKFRVDSLHIWVQMMDT